MAKELKKHQLNLNERDYKCFGYLCDLEGMSRAERIRHLIHKDLKEHQEIILEGMEEQKKAIEKRSRNGH